MTPEVHELRIKSARCRCYIAAKMELVSALQKTRGNAFLTDPIEEAIKRIDYRIQSIFEEIRVSVCKLRGFNRDRMYPFELISEVDLKLGKIDISIARDGTTVLDLESGEILCI